MSFIGKNIKKIRAVKKMSQQDFAQLFKLARPSVGAYEEGRAEPKIETVIQIASYFQLSIDTILTKELTINELLKFDIFKEEFQKDEIQAHINKDEIPEQTPYVSNDNSLEYIVNYKNKDFINNLPVIQFPYTESKKSRAFQISGSEMENGNCGIHHRDILFCKPVEGLNKSSLVLNELYVIITSDAIRVRRLKIIETTLTFKTDNPAYEELQIEVTSILELWKVVALFSNNIKSPTLLEERVAKLEAQLQQITNLG